MKYSMLSRRGPEDTGYKTAVATLVTILVFGLSAFGDEGKPDLYVPYQDLVQLIEPADKAVLMERGEFEELLSAAEANEREADSLELGQVETALYTADVTGDKLTLTGTLEVVSMSNKPVAVPLAFGQVGLSQVKLDGRAAPLGYNKQGKLTLVMTEKGSHKLSVSGTTKLTEIASGGMKFSVTLPETVAGRMTLSATGDLEIHATAPASETKYDKQTDRSSVELTLGGHSELTVVLLGNGRQEDEQAILLGESAATVSLDRSHETLSCFYTVQVLRRGVRQLQFNLASAWTVTEVTCPNLVKWSVTASSDEAAMKTLTVRMRSGKAGGTVLHIRATADRGRQSRLSPRVSLVGAAFEHGYLMVNMGEELGVRGEKLVDARREDATAVASAPGLIAGPGARLYFHWGSEWAVDLEVENVELRRSIREQQRVVVSPEEVTVTGDFEVTAVDRELFTMSFVPGGTAQEWRIKTVQVDEKETGFEYRLDDEGSGRKLHIELPQPVKPEKVVKVRIVLQHVPSDWVWPSDAAARSITVPLIESDGETITGHISISATGDLDASPTAAAEGLEKVPVGRMVSLGMARGVQHAYSYNAAVKGSVELEVSRRRPRVSGESVGVISVRANEFSGDWRIVYLISRATTKKLFVLVDKKLGQEVQISSPSMAISSKAIVTPGDSTVALSDEPAQRYNLWLLNLDRKAIGEVVVMVRYEQPLPEGSFEIPLVRPICEGQTDEELAIQANEELAIDIGASGAKEIDAVDLPGLPVEAQRILSAFRLDGPATTTGAEATVSLRTVIHKNYSIPSALAMSGQLRTYLDVTGQQRTEATFEIANAGNQFLTMRLPETAELWSLRVNDRQARPQRGVGGDYQVSLGQLGKAVRVKIVYSYKPAEAAIGQIELGAVELPDIEVNKIRWYVIPPPNYRVTTQETKMQTRDIRRPRPACVKLYHWMRNNAFLGSPLLHMMMTGQQIALSRGRFAGGGGGGGGGGSGAVAYGPVDEQRAVKLHARGIREEGEEVRRSAAARQMPAMQDALGGRLLAKGKFTLPVELVPTAGAGPEARFTALGAPRLIVGLTNRSWLSSCWVVGFALIATIGAALIRRRAKGKVLLIVAVLAISSLAAIWIPATANFANGCFTAGLCLLPLYVVVAVGRRLGGRLSARDVLGQQSAAVVVVLGLLLCVGCSGRAAAAGPSSKENKAVATPAVPGDVATSAAARQYRADLPPVIVPYEGDATTAEESDKVLIPYSRFVELWNRAHPEDTIDGPKPGTDISLAAVQYEVKVGREQVELVLTAEVRTYGRGRVMLGLAMDGLAMTEGSFDGKAAQLLAGPAGEMLMLPGEASGRLQVRAVARPEYFGRRGSASFTLPPLPGAVMKVVLPQDDLELEVDGIEGVLSQQKIQGETQWTVPLGMTRKLSLRWLPKLGGGAADRTLSAASVHDVYAFHWALMGVSRIAYNFSAGEHGRFNILLPGGATLMDLKGTNVRDYREVGEKTIEGKVFRVLQVRLHRAAKRQYELTVRWLGELPALDEAGRLYLVRADDVSRESGTVTLHSAGGMVLKVTEVQGGRRTSIPAVKETQSAEPTSDQARPTARYYWPYRPFSLFVQLSRLTVAPKIHLDQLVRISPERVQLLVQADLRAERGKLFGASFVLPKGYELLSAVGPAVENFYKRETEAGRFLHIKFDRGRQESKVALVLVRSATELADFSVPKVMYIDAAEEVVSEQRGRTAVQVSASLEAETVTSENLKGISPATLKDWLDEKQINSVQFAYRYETADVTLRLRLRPRPTRIRVETFAGLGVRTTAAAYTYRLRYNISGSPVDRLSFELPGEYSRLAAVESPAMRNVTQSDAGNGRTRWDVSLVNEVTGIVDVIVNFAVPIDASTQELAIPLITTEAEADYRAILVVQNMSRHEINIGERRNLRELAPSEQQRLMPAEMRESLQYVFQSFEKDWALSLDFKPARPATRIQAVVDLLALTTVAGRNGQCRYEARIALQNRSEQFLRVKAPKGLRLWSAKVAEQPVKPVIAGDSQEAEILIPLVKTSPGGLPYEVYLYFAGQVVAPLNGLSRLEPPNISIVGIPVTRTTWSLRLPAGYRYMRPGGNMVPAAGTVEMLSFGIEAKLEQLSRLEKTYRDVVGTRSKKEQIARVNWDVFNRKLAAEITTAEKYLEGNRREVSKEDYRRLSSRLAGQKQVQNVLLGDNTAFVERQQEQLSNDMNVYLNYSASNTGVAEIARNNALWEKPDFVVGNEAAQIERLEKELVLSAKEQAALQDAEEYKKLLREDIVVGKAADSKADKAAGELILDIRSKDENVERMLTEITRDSAVQIKQKQAQIRGQLEELKEGRLQRYYQADLDRLQAPPAQPQAGVAGQQIASAAMRRRRELPSETAGISAYGYGRGTRQDGQQAIAAGRLGSFDYGDAAGDAADALAIQVQTEEPMSAEVRAGGVQSFSTVSDISAASPATLQPYVAAGTYSLPVSLPTGEVRLDFARPSGDAQLSLWAVPVGSISSLYSSLTVIVGTILVLVVVKTWPRTGRKQPLCVKRIILYFFFAMVLIVILGFVGLLISTVAIVLAEARRGAFAATEMPNK